MTAARTQLALVAAVQVLGLAVWFSATAIVPSLRAEWGLTSVSAVWLTASVQIGFAAGAVTSSVLGLADRFAPQRVMATGALGACLCTAGFAAYADGLGTATPLRVATGFCLAAIYPVGMKLTASWAAPVDRGRAFGVLIGALTLGSALPHLLASAGPLPWRGVMAGAAGLTLAAALTAWLAVRPGPLLVAGTRPRASQVLQGFRHSGPRLANLGYLGHMWELYAFWTWLPAYLAISRADAGSSTVSLLTFAVVGLAGVAGCLLGGWSSDRHGRGVTAAAALATSGACCLLSPFLVPAPGAVVVAFCCVWGAAVIADSGVFSTALSETADQRYVGTALTVQTATGFALTVVSIALVPVVATAVGQQWAFLLLAPGPALGVVAMLRFRARHELDRGVRAAG